jgi:hypothetical protein
MIIGPELESHTHLNSPALPGYICGARLSGGSS